MKQKKQYKAIVLDLDGTVVENNRHALPSEKVTRAIKLAQQKISVSVATARGIYDTQKILNALDIKGPSIISGGSEIRDSHTGEILWNRIISDDNSKKIVKMFEDKYDIWINDSNYYKFNNYYKKGHPPKQASQISIVDVPLERSLYHEKKLHRISEINVYKALSWEKTDHVWITITHNEASKQHGIFEIAKILGIETHEIIGVGDGYNDFPLLMACGLRVAMGNAVPELKEIADYIAPTVEDDGVADVIEKFIL